MSSSTFLLFLFISCAVSVQVQEKERLRQRIVLSEIDREAFNGGYDYHSMQRRSVSSGPTPTPTQPPVIGHFARLTGDRHNLAIVHWSGENSTAIFILTVVRYRNGSSRQSNLWRSINYGFNFTMDNNKVNNTVLDYYYINPHNKTKLIFTAEIAQRLYITENEGDSYSCVKVPFVPNDVDYSPFLEESVTAYDQTHKALFVSADHGKTWTSVGKNITKYYWEVLESEDYTKIYFEQLHGSGSKVYVISAPYHSANIKEFQPSSNRYHFDQSSLVLSHEYILSQVTANGSATLYVSHNRGPFVAAQFPLHNQLHEKDYLLVDASEGQVFVAVNHRSNLTSLYMSEALGISYTLVLEDVVTTSDASWASNSATVQLYHVLGVQGTYFVNQHRHDRTPWTLVSFDKGAQWLTVPAPAVDNHGRGTYCYQPNCSLQLDVRSMFSRDSSIGLIWAQGNVGQSKTTRNEGSFMSRDGGLTWQWVFDAYFLASFADHGAVIAAAQRTYTYRQRTTNQIQHSCDEGTTWKSITMPLSIHVIGVLTEPGERSLIISVFGFENGWTEWLMGQLDFRQIASDPCKPTDYYNWIPTDERIGRRCLLGQSVVYRRRKADVCCFNGYDFEVPISTSICECAKEDFECDFGYERAELGSPCMPSPGTPSKGPPSICPEGQSYNVTRGYRKVAGDVCHIGNEAMSFIQEVLPCPIDPPGGLTIKCDHSIVSPGEKLTFVLKQSSGGIITTSYTWSFDDGTQDQTFIGYSNSQTVVHAFSRSRDSPYLISVVAQNAGGQISAIKPIVVYDKIVNAEVVYLKPVVKNILATFSVHLDTSQNQSYGSVQYLWYPSKGSFSIVTNLPVFSHIYKEAGLYEAKVDISNYLPNVAPLTVHYQVTVNSGPGGLLLTASPSRIAAGQRVSFTLNQTVGTTKNSTVYTWNFGDGHTINVTSFSHSHHVVHQYLNSSRTLYKIKVTAITGFADASASTYIVVNDAITDTSAKIHKPEQQIIENEIGTYSVVYLDDSIYGTVQYSWDMGEGTDPKTTSVPLLNYAYKQGGNFHAQVTLNNSLPGYYPYKLKFNVTVESETLVSVTIHVTSTLLAVNHEYSFSVTAKAQSKSGIVDYEGYLQCLWKTGGTYGYKLPGPIVSHSYGHDDVGRQFVSVSCSNSQGKSKVTNSITVTVVDPTTKVVLTNVDKLSKLYEANATNDVVRSWTMAARNELAKVFELQSKQLLVILHPSNNSVEIIVLPLSESSEDISQAEQLAKQISRKAKGVQLIMTVNNDTEYAVIGQSMVVKLNPGSQGGNSNSGTLYVAVGVGIGSLVLVTLLVFGVYYYRRKYGQLEVQYRQLRQTGQGNFVYSGGAETIGEEEQEPGTQYLKDPSTMRMSKIEDNFD